MTVVVTDNSSTPNPVFGAPVTFLNILSRSGTTGPSVTIDDVTVNPISDTIILGSETSVALSAIGGTASTSLFANRVTAGERVSGLATVDSGAQVPFFLQVIPGPIEGLPSKPASVSHPARATSVNSAQTQPSIFSAVFTGLFAGFASPQPDADSADNTPQETDSLPSSESAEHTPKQRLRTVIMDEAPPSPTQIAPSNDSTQKETSAPNPCEDCAGRACAVALKRN